MSHFRPKLPNKLSEGEAMSELEQLRVDLFTEMSCARMQLGSITSYNPQDMETRQNILKHIKNCLDLTKEVATRLDNLSSELLDSKFSLFRR